MPNTTNESRLARAVAASPAAAGLSYQQALTAVRAASADGALPHGMTRATPAAVRAVLRHRDPRTFPVLLGRDADGHDVTIPLFDLRMHVHLTGDAPDRDAMVALLLAETGAQQVAPASVPTPTVETPLAELTGTADALEQQTVIANLSHFEDRYWNAVVEHVTARAVDGADTTLGSALTAMHVMAHDPTEGADSRKVAEAIGYRLGQLTRPGHDILTDLTDSATVVRALRRRDNDSRQPRLLRLYVRDTSSSHAVAARALSRARMCGVMVVVESELGAEALPAPLPANINLTLEQTAHGWDVRAHRPALRTHVQH